LGSSSEFEESINVDLASLLIQLNPIQLSTLLEYATRWNSNTRTSRIAQILLNCVLNSIPPEQILDISGVDSVVKAFIPYTQRLHFCFLHD
jgi:U3 small nucleolar RNA-associated protein 13